MILGPVSYLDCIVFCVFLAPQLIWQAGLFRTIFHASRAVPFLVWQLPVAFLYDRLLAGPEKQPPFVQRSSPFEDVAIRCIRYGFANIPPEVGRVFFSKQVALPFLRYRMLRHGYLRYPVHWSERTDVRDPSFVNCDNPSSCLPTDCLEQKHFKGIWMVKDQTTKSDFVLYYVHGGGFSLGSSYFYLEFLLSWISLLAERGYENPAIFALEYTLVPDATFPTQLQETISGYQHVLSVARDPSIVCVSGDSAGAALILSLLLYIANPSRDIGRVIGNGDGGGITRPALAVLISPWATLVSSRYRNSTSDYLDADTLKRYGQQFAGSRVSRDDPLVSPGSCKDGLWWRKASPEKGIVVTYGQEEMLAPEIRELTCVLQKAGVTVESEGEAAGIHAWPVASHFVSGSTRERHKGIKNLVEKIRDRVH